MLSWSDLRMNKGFALPETVLRIAIVVLLGIAVALVLHLKNLRNERPAEVAVSPVLAESAPAKLPRLVDLGADKCIPCKMMAPILEEMRTTYQGRLDVEFIDVWKNPDAGAKYNINLIPTQILFDASGKELFRHEGFFSKEDILAKWKEFGVDLSGTSPPQTAAQGPNSGPAGSAASGTHPAGEGKR